MVPLEVKFLIDLSIAEPSYSPPLSTCEFCSTNDLPTVLGPMTSIFIDDMENFQIINEVYGRYFKKGNEPARETVAVKTLPKNVRVETSMIACKGD